MAVYEEFSTMDMKNINETLPLTYYWYFIMHIFGLPPVGYTTSNMFLMSNGVNN